MSLTKIFEWLNGCQEATAYTNNEVGQHCRNRQVINLHVYRSAKVHLYAIREMMKVCINLCNTFNLPSMI